MGLRKEIGYTVLDLFMSVENNRNPDFVRITTYWTHKNDRLVELFRNGLGKSGF